MPTKTIEKPEVAVIENKHPSLAGPEWKQFAGQPLVDVILPLLEGDETNVKPDQNFKYTINDKDFIIERGRHKWIPRDHYLVLRVGMPRL